MTLDQDLEEEYVVMDDDIYDNYTEDDCPEELRNLPKNVKHIQHDKVFENHCKKDVVSDMWYGLYRKIIKSIEDDVLDKDYTTEVYDVIKSDFDNMERLYESLHGDLDLHEIFRDNLEDLTSAISRILECMEARLDPRYNNAEITNYMIQRQIDDIQAYENELTFLYNEVVYYY